MKFKNTTFVKILLIYSHYKPGKPFLKGAPFFWQPPVDLRVAIYCNVEYDFAIRHIYDLRPNIEIIL